MQIIDICFTVSRKMLSHEIKAVKNALTLTCSNSSEAIELMSSSKFRGLKRSPNFIETIRTEHKLGFDI